MCNLRNQPNAFSIGRGHFDLATIPIADPTDDSRTLIGVGQVSASDKMRAAHVRRACGHHVLPLTIVTNEGVRVVVIVRGACSSAHLRTSSRLSVYQNNSL